MKDWKEYEVEPDEGVFEKVERRLKMRRLWRVGGWTAAAAVVVAVGVLVATMRPTAPTQERETVAEKAVVPTMPAEVPVVAEATDERPETATPTAAVLPATAVRETVAPVVAATAVQSVASEPAKAVAETAVAAAPVAKPAPAPAAPKAEAEPVRTAGGEGEENAVAEGTAEVHAAKAGEGETTPTVHEDNVVWVPNAIAPHSDVDDVRTFRMVFTSTVDNFNIQIFNRRGMRVYSSSDPQFQWDGTFDGSDVPQGAYVWVATFRDTSGRLRQEKGTVTVVR